MLPMIKFCKIISIVFVASLLVVVIASAQNFHTTNTETPDKIELIVGKSKIKNFQELKIQLLNKDELQIQIGAPEIADYKFLPDDKFLIIGKKAGVTNMILSLKGKKPVRYFDIEVKYDLSRLKQDLYRMMPDEKNIKVMATNDSLTLYGKVSNTGNLAQTMALAQSYVPKDKINNFLEVGGVHQIMLEVKMAEMSRSIGKQLGINMGSLDLYTGELAITQLGGLTKYSDGDGFTYSDAVNALFRFNRGGFSWSAFINALKEDGLVKILAEPNLTALSGQTASFLAGGEYPIPVPSDDGITIDYKKYGVGLSFTPSVLDKDKISIDVTSTVSELDFSTAVQFSGYVVPALTTRTASTVVQLADGQSFAIAGLLSESIKEKVKKYPFLGDIPILGTLFKSTSFQKNETELIIIVTPRFVKPMIAKNQPLPTDYYNETDDAEIFFNLKKNNKESFKQERFDAELDGQFGHSFETE